VAAIHKLSALQQIVQENFDHSTLVNRSHHSASPRFIIHIEDHARRDLCNLDSGGGMRYAHNR